MVDPKQGYNNAKCKESLLNSVRERTNNKVLDKSENIWIMSLEYVQRWKIVAKFQLNWTGARHFQLKLFDTAVTLKYGPGHWKWYEQVKLNEQYHHAKFDIHHIYGVIQMLKFLTSQDTWPTKNMSIISLEQCKKSN